jgi:Trk K+ transport system NAD-binding subunit
LIVLVLAPFVVLGIALLYMLGMDNLEGQPRTFLAAVLWASETITSTGYGGDNHWTHPAMVALVAGVQFLGVMVLFTAFPLFVMPFFEERFEERLHRTLPKKLDDFVLIYRWGATVSELVDQLRDAKVRVVVFEESEDVARRIQARGINVVYGNLEDEDPEPRLIQRARAVVVNGEDAENGAFVLWARQAGFEGEIYGFMDEPAHRAPLLAAGATAVYTADHILAAALAAVASERISPRIAGIKQLGKHVRADELRISRGSELAGKTLAEAHIRRETGATVVAIWEGGTFDPDPKPTTRMQGGSIVVALGSDAAIQRFAKLAHPLPSTGPILLCGYGEVGKKVAQLLRDAGEDLVVLDQLEMPGVDHVANAMDGAALGRAGAASAQAIIIAIDSDRAGVFATTVARDVAPDVPIIGRVNRSGNVTRVHRAGADFALSTAQVAAQILGMHLLGEEAISFELSAKVVKAQPGELAGKGPMALDVRSRTGCSVVAVERGEEVIVDFAADFTIEPSDVIYVVGSDEAVVRFHREYPSTRTNKIPG